MYKCKNNLLPVALINSNDFTVRNTLAYNKRNPEQLELPFASHNTIRSSIKFNGPAIWNEISKNIDFNVINNLTLFTNTIRYWCISNYCNNAYKDYFNKVVFSVEQIFFTTVYIITFLHTVLLSYA
jgi:hypothetical protein